MLRTISSLLLLATFLASSLHAQPVVYKSKRYIHPVLPRFELTLGGTQVSADSAEIASITIVRGMERQPHQTIDKFSAVLPLSWGDYGLRVEDVNMDLYNDILLPKGDTTETFFVWTYDKATEYYARDTAFEKMPNVEIRREEKTLVSERREPNGDLIVERYAVENGEPVPLRREVTINTGTSFEIHIYEWNGEEFELREVVAPEQSDTNATPSDSVGTDR
jgi:hypothetical protein